LIIRIAPAKSMMMLKEIVYLARPVFDADIAMAITGVAVITAPEEKAREAGSLLAHSH